MRATKVVHWPGRDIPACDEHAQKIAEVAHALGFKVSTTALNDDKVCSSCEYKKHLLIDCRTGGTS